MATAARGKMLPALMCTRLYLHRITSVVISELASCHKEFQNPVMKASRYKQLEATCLRKYRDACSVTSLNRIKHRRLSPPRLRARVVAGKARLLHAARVAERPRLAVRPTGDWIGCQGSPAWFGAAGMATKLTWLVLGPDPSVCSCRAEQFTAH